MTDQQPKNLSFRFKLNIWTLKFARNWLKVVITFLAIWVSLPFIAPTLMHLGAEGPARVLYTVYAPFCHQFPFRSFFLFGEQPVYPRTNAGTNWNSFESYATNIDEFADFTSEDDFSLNWTLTNKNFFGNDELGYKVTLCERDIMIYGAIFIGAIIYSIPFIRKRLRPVPILIYVILGICPIAIDGFSQLLGYPPFEFWEPRETLPEFRVLTGALFGFMNVWLGFPYLEGSFKETRENIEAKLRRSGIKI